MNATDWKSVVLVAIGAALAASAAFSHCDDKLLFVAVVIISGALGMSVPGVGRDPSSRTRATDAPTGRIESGR
jgi:hypothetical protein